MAKNFKNWVQEMQKRRILEWRVNFIFDFIFFCLYFDNMYALLLIIFWVERNSFVWSWINHTALFMTLLSFGHISLLFSLCIYMIHIYFIHFYSHIHILSPLPPNKSSSFCLYVTLQNIYCFLVYNFKHISYMVISHFVGYIIY